LHPREAAEVCRGDAEHVLVGARPGPDQVVVVERAVHQHRVDVRERERSDRARCESRRLLDLLRPRDAHRPGFDRPRDLLRIASSITGHERHDRPVVAEEDERLHDLAELAAHGVRGVLCGGGAVGKLLDARLDSRFAEEGGDPLDGLRPGADHDGSLPCDGQ
jgi:hypothetical protein